MSMSESDKKRITTRIRMEDYDYFERYAKSKGMTLSELIGHSVEFYIAYQRKDYPITEPLEVARLRELSDGFTLLAQRVDLLTELVEDLKDSLLLLFRGDNYLIEMGDDE